MEYEAAVNIIKSAGSNPVMVLINGNQKKRFAISNTGSLMEMAKNSRRHGYPLFQDAVSAFQTLQPIIPKVKSLNPLERMAEKLWKWKRYIEKNRRPSYLWTELGEEAAKITREKLDKYVSQAKAENSYEAWKAVEDFDMRHIEGFKTLTLATCQCPEWTMKRIAEAIEKRENFREGWRSDYDYSCSGNTAADGKYRAWLSQEFKNCGNGHYYLLISSTQAIFCEDD